MIEVEAIVNGDGTKYDPPKNPLKEKWDGLFPGCESTGYKCMFCGECPHGDYWKVPDEDKDIYDAYLQTVQQYNAEHGNLYLPKIILRKVDE